MAKMTQNTFSTLYELGESVYEGKIDLKTAAQQACQRNPEVAISSAKHYILWYTKMRAGEYLTWNSNSDLLLYYAKRIAEENGGDAGGLAIYSAIQFARHVSRTELERDLYHLAENMDIEVEPLLNLANDIESQKTAFKSWLKNLETHKYTEHVIYKYTRALDMAEEWLSIKLPCHIFSITTCEDFDKCIKIIKSVPNFTEINKAHGHGDLSAALSLYSKFIAKKTNMNSVLDWWPSLEEYTPGFTKDQWLEILNNPEIVGPVWGGVLAMFHTEPQGATCKMIADKFNDSPYSISGKSTQLAKRIHAETNCPIFKRDNDETEKLNFWTILFQGRDAKNDEPGTWVWRLRRELYDALTEFGIEKYLPDVSKLGKFDSWEIIDEVTAIKHCDKSFFEYNTSGVPKGICWFFDAEELADGESKPVKFICDGIEYAAKVANDTTDRRRTKIAWNSDLANVFYAYKNDVASATFKKTTENTYEITMSKEGEEMTTKQKVEVIKTYIVAKGFNYEGNLIENFYLSLKSKPFVILAGTSGTGKTRLVKLFAEAIGAKMKLVPVRPDWSDSSDLFGHTDLSGKFQLGAIIDFIKQAEWNKDTPYFLCLDEMNLARVEYYLSDFLSVIETRDRKENGDIETDAMVDVDYYKDKDAKSKYGRVFIPDNLYIVGTVNMDETTFPFSKKVLDRANTIEFSFVNLMAKPAEFFAMPNPLKEDNSFLKTEYLYLRDCNDSDVIDDVCFDLEELNAILVKANLHVGYRVRDEISFYMMNNKNADLLTKESAFDNEIMQKILPRIQGSSRAIKDVLSEMFIKCAGDYTGLAGVTDFEQMQSYMDAAKDCKYPNSAKKIVFMMRRYEEDGFTSYWL